MCQRERESVNSLEEEEEEEEKGEPVRQSVLLSLAHLLSVKIDDERKKESDHHLHCGFIHK